MYICRTKFTWCTAIKCGVFGGIGAGEPLGLDIIPLRPELWRHQLIQ